MNRKWLVSIAVAVCAVLLPLAAAAQVEPDRPEKAEDPYAGLKWKAYAGAGYTAINQVNQSRYGLIGVDLAVSRDFGRYWAVVGNGSFYSVSYASGNPGNPSVDLVLFGPEIHGRIFERWTLFGRALIGGAHTGGTDQTPTVSFAGGLGGGLEYALNHRISLRVSGDNIASAFSLSNNTSELGYSPHTRWNARGGVGVAYRF